MHFIKLCMLRVDRAHVGACCPNGEHTSFLLDRAEREEGGVAKREYSFRKVRYKHMNHQ